MLRHPLFLLCICLSLILAAYDASAKPRRTDTAEYGTKSTQTVKAKSAKSHKSQSAKSKSAKSNSKPKFAKAKDSRKYKKSSRDIATLPVIDETFAETTDSVLTALSAIPADGDISSFFGMRRLSGKTKRVRMHTGIDITAARGTSVLAAGAGVVCFVGRWGAYGRIVEIDHGNGLVTRYAHLDRYNVEEGAKVASGEPIGAVGRSGRTTGAHLHFETLVNGRAVNPMVAEMWRQTPEQLAAKRGTYVSGLHAASKRAY